MEKLYKKTYTTPTAEKIEFNYQNQVVAQSGCYYAISSTWGIDCDRTHDKPTREI